MNIALVAITALVTNIFLGRQRSRFRKMTFMWWVMIHASIPLIIPMRILLGTPLYCIPIFIGLAVAGQFIGSRFFGVKRRGESRCEVVPGEGNQE